MLEFITKRFRKAKKNDLDNRVAQSENQAPFSVLTTGLGGLFNFGNKDSVYDLYANNEICRAGVDKLANDLASLNYMLDGVAKGKEEPELKKILDTINSREYKQMMVDSWKDFILDGFMAQTKSRGSATKELYFRRIIIKNSQVKANYDKGQIEAIELATGVIERTDINGMSNKLFLFGNRDPRESMLAYISPISAVLGELQRLKCARDWNNDLLKRGGISPVLLSLKEGGSLSGAQTQEILKSLDSAQKHNNGSSIGLIPVEGMNIHVIGTTAKDLDFIEGQKQAVNNILLGMGIPPEVMGLNEKQAAMGTKLDAIQGYYNSTIIPNAERYAGMLSRWLNEYTKYDSTEVEAKPGDMVSIPLKSKINLMVDKSSIPYSQDIQAKRMQDLQDITFMTDNEKRAMFNLAPLEAVAEVVEEDNKEENGDE